MKLFSKDGFLTAVKRFSVLSLSAVLVAGSAFMCFAESENPEEETAAESVYADSEDVGSEEACEYEDVFAEWDPDAPALQVLIDYVESVTDEVSPDYIPVEDRIAVFDMDGTLYGELFPTYLEYYYSTF